MWCQEIVISARADKAAMGVEEADIARNICNYMLGYTAGYIAQISPRRGTEPSQRGRLEAVINLVAYVYQKLSGQCNRWIAVTAHY